MFETSTSLKKIETMKLNDVHVFDTFTFAEIALSLVLQWYILFVSSKNPPVRTYIFLSQAKQVLVFLGSHLQVRLVKIQLLIASPPKKFWVFALKKIQHLLTTVFWKAQQNWLKKVISS